MKLQVKRLTPLARNLWQSRTQPVVYISFSFCFLLLLVIGMLFKDPVHFRSLPEPQQTARTLLSENGNKREAGQSYVHLVWTRHELTPTKVAHAGVASHKTSGTEVADFGEEDSPISTIDQDGFDEEAVEIVKTPDATKVDLVTLIDGMNSLPAGLAALPPRP